MFVFATKNQAKLREIREILTNFPIRSMEEAGLFMDITEDGETFRENALLKAKAVALASGGPAMADDSGLEIDFLDKRPGVMSARFLGEDTPYDIKNRRILSLMKDAPEPKRIARFICVIAAVFPDGRELTAEGSLEGLIAYEPKGENGFGYDPIFYVPSLAMTTAEMTPRQKNKLSHRGQALRRMRETLDEI